MLQRFVLAGVLVLALVSPSGAYSLSCAELSAIGADAGAGDEASQVALGSFLLGVSDMLAALVCFGGDPRCACLSDLAFSEAGLTRFGRALALELDGCPAYDPAVGRVFNAALAACAR